MHILVIGMDWDLEPNGTCCSGGPRAVWIGVARNLKRTEPMLPSASATRVH
jgi:hypothetical protein